MRVSIEQAAGALKAGHVIAVPTETVYGLAASLHAPQAIEKIFILKGRPLANPLIIHVAGRDEMDPFVTKYPPHFDKLAKTFWPGPLTVILPVNDSIPMIVRAGLPTAGFRIPANAFAQELLRMTGPLVMPSANLSGRPSATTPEHVEEDFGKDFPVLDGGKCPKGLESTILVYQEPEWMIARLGALPTQAFEPILGYHPKVIQKTKESQPLCPGQLYRHYAPKARLILGDLEALSDASFVLGFKERSYPKGKKVIVLGSVSNPEEVAGNLYEALRQLDLEMAQEAWMDMDFPKDGLWQTICERLTRAGEYSDCIT